MHYSRAALIIASVYRGPFATVDLLTAVCSMSDVTDFAVKSNPAATHGRPAALASR